MALPNFIGIGVQRGGSTWLHTLLISHPSVYLPTRRKEVRFFDRDYERGLEWYKTFFPSQEEAKKFQAIGEISPQYYRCDECPERIFNAIPKCKLLIILRHPIARAYSNYGFNVQRWNYRGSFEDYLFARPQMLERGFYSRYLKRYLRYYDRSQILIMLFEEAVSDINNTKQILADFLDISHENFPSNTARRKVNASSIPKFRSLYGITTRTAFKFKKRQLHPIVDFVKRLGVQQILAKGKPLPPLDEETKKRLSMQFLDEFDELEKVMQIDLSRWRA